MSLNKVMLIGRLDDKPHILEVGNAHSRVGLSIVTTSPNWCDIDSGEQRCGAEWHRVVIVDPRLAAFARANLRQGDQVYIEGRLQTDYWQDETYQWRSLTTIVINEGNGELRRLEHGDPPDRPHAPPKALFDRLIRRKASAGIGANDHAG